MLDRRFAEVLPSLYVPSDEFVPPSGLLLQPLVGVIATSYVIEQGDATRALTSADIAMASTTLADLHALALANLARHVELTSIRLNAYGSIMAVIFDGDMEATLMLYPELWTRLHDEMGEHLAVVVPARDVLAIAPADSSDGVAELRAVIERVWPRDDHPLSTDILGHSDGVWSVLAPFAPA